MSDEFILKGVELAPAGRNRPDTERNLHRIHGVISGKDRESGAEELMAGQANIFASSSGVEIAILPSHSGPCQVEWISGSEITSLSDELARGGFIPVDHLARMSGAARKTKPSEPSTNEIKEVLLKSFNEIGVLKAQGSLSDHSSSNAKTRNDDPIEKTHAASDPGTAPTHPPNDEKKNEPALLDGLPGAAQSAAASALATYLGKGVLTAGDLTQDIVGGFASMGAEFLMGKLLGGPPDDGASVAEWATAVVGPQMAKQVLAGPLGKTWGKWINNSPYSSLALRMGDVDLVGNGIIARSKNVFIEGLPAAVAGDKLDGKGLPSGTMLKFGAKLVQINGEAAARADSPHTGYGTISEPATQPFILGASKTYVGGVTTCPNPPPLDEITKATGIASPHDPDKPNPVADPEAPMPNEKGMYWSPDKDDPTVGEWRMWDPDFGWSATPSEAFASNALFGNMPNWDARRNGSFLISNWLYKLGTPEWPGAGQGASWWVPDEFFPGLFGRSENWNIDMKKGLSNLHDWLFQPDNLNWSIWDHLSKTEWPAFVEGFKGNRNPLQWLFKGIYSSATVLATLVFYSSEYFDQKLQRELIGHKEK